MWIIGYNKKCVLSIWNGYDNNIVIGNSAKGFHKNIWIDTMESYLKDEHNEWYDMPKDVVGVPINPISGKLDDKNNKTIFYFLRGTEPTYKNTDLETAFREDNKNIKAN